MNGLMHGWMDGRTHFHMFQVDKLFLLTVLSCCFIGNYYLRNELFHSQLPLKTTIPKMSVQTDKHADGRDRQTFVTETECKSISKSILKFVNYEIKNRNYSEIQK